MVQKVVVKREFETGAMRRLENSLCQPSRKRGLFFELGKVRQRKEKDELRLSSAVPKIQWDSNLHCPYGY